MKECERPNVGLGVILLDFKTERVLCGQRKGSYESGCYGFPGGHLEKFEELVDCGKRELAEEIGFEEGINFKPIDYNAVAATNDCLTLENKHYVTLFLRFDYLRGIAENLEPEKCYGWNWFSWKKLPTPLSLPIKNLIVQGYNPFR